MELIKRQTSCMIVADEGKMIKDKNDIYKDKVYDEEGNIIEEEHIPYYTDVIFVPQSFTEEMMNDLYVEVLENDIIVESKNENIYSRKNEDERENSI